MQRGSTTTIGQPQVSFLHTYFFNNILHEQLSDYRIMTARFSLWTAVLFFLSCASLTAAFAPSSPHLLKTRLAAGGFEWEDPTEAYDQGVDNPFKNPELMKGEEENLLTIMAGTTGAQIEEEEEAAARMKEKGESRAFRFS